MYGRRRIFFGPFTKPIKWEARSTRSKGIFVITHVKFILGYFRKLEKLPSLRSIIDSTGRWARVQHYGKLQTEQRVKERRVKYALPEHLYQRQPWWNWHLLHSLWSYLHRRQAHWQARGCMIIAFSPFFSFLIASGSYFLLFLKKFPFMVMGFSYYW